MADADFKGAIQVLTRLVAAQSQQQESAPVHVSSQPHATSRVMSPPVFTGSKVEDPRDFIDEIQKILW
ncbi:hypothetical protein HAX54_002751, partial [Datura stramonium]|nr:hypothetical protein [Datura stramonium]